MSISRVKVYALLGIATGISYLISGKTEWDQAFAVSINFGAGAALAIHWLLNPKEPRP